MLAFTNHPALCSALFYWIERHNVPSADAEDILHDILVILQEKYSSHAQEEIPKIAFGIARRLIAEWHRKRRKSTQHLAGRREGHIDSAEVVLEEDLRTNIARAFARIPSPAQDILRMHVVEGLSFAQVATTLGISEPMVRRTFALAIIKLRNNIRK